MSVIKENVDDCGETEVDENKIPLYWFALEIDHFPDICILKSIFFSSSICFLLPPELLKLFL